ncbi:AbrB/MazE/SpoVT family DNA-binding domain-containing protein [Chloroflexota bacterium]
MGKAPEFTVSKRIMKSGNGLFVPVPNEVIEQWNLGKGDEVSISVADGAIRMEPKKPSKMETVSEEMVETYSKVMKGIQAKITLDNEGNALHLEFEGENKEAVKSLLYNLWRNLPALFSMLGVGSVEETEKAKPEKAD